MRLLPVLSLVAATLGAQTPPPAVPVHTLTTTAVSHDTFGAPLSVQALPGGRVLVNDGKLHRLLILDSTMRVVHVVFDSVQGRSDSYGTRPAPVLPYGSESCLGCPEPREVANVLQHAL